MMGKGFSRRLVLGAALSLFGGAALGDAPLSSPRPVARAADGPSMVVKSSDDLINAIGLSGKVGFVVADARTGLILETRNPLLGLPPASVAKALTAQYGLEKLGPTYAFATQLLATGPVQNGRLNGDLVLRGGGDPTLSTDAIAELAVALKSAGVREVTGAFLVDGSALPKVDQIDKAQPDYLGYNPSISGLILNYNRVHFEWKRAGDGYSVAMDARSEKYRPAVSMARMQIVDRKFPVYTYVGKNSTDFWTVSRSALNNSGSRWLPVRQPETYAGEVFRSFARSNGITMKAPTLATAPQTGTVLVERKSPPLQRILKDMLRYSTNLTAETVGLMASGGGNNSADALPLSAGKMNTWAKTRLGLRQPAFVDHSGLGDRSRISASDMVAALVRMGPDSTLASILKSIPLRDAKGNTIKNSPVRVNAKTGTLNFVSGLAGFIKAADGTDLAFAIFAADLDKRAAIPDSDREKPRGARGWNSQAQRVQQALIDRWSKLYGT